MPRLRAATPRHASCHDTILLDSRHATSRHAAQARHIDVRRHATMMPRHRAIALEAAKIRHCLLRVSRHAAYAPLPPRHAMLPIDYFRYDAALPQRHCLLRAPRRCVLPSRL